ncbi:MAG TPA: Rieske 2Fe-2S domain-containing protein [Geminicoccus sp.]|jgi:3-phenylpropionate/trans-cinnamate dioxygenase ferredoxin subunit|uniref:Rieske (2Fe-2S) protein n=1 Tax=Geminicoccus sp. TaxID=2024832 RepID=UPI002E304842|nr:Rieske 2Fe-2S domain-containing protein [Geminicoccus sp.]HEX2524874.1 Rieske 2Fe-2S domain-containing protein [Geminicoccus sp.]
MAKHVVATTGEIPVGGSKLVEIRGRPIAVFNVKGEYFALYDKCPHEGGSLCRGKLTSLVDSSGPGNYRLSRQGEIVRCPWHGWEFDVRTGKSYCDPVRMRVRNYAVSVEPGTRIVEGPYQAETFPVSVEGEYVVVEM